MALFSSSGLAALNQSLNNLSESDFRRAQAEQAQGNAAKQFGLQKLASERAQNEMNFRQNETLTGDAEKRFTQAMLARAGDSGMQANPQVVTYLLQNGTLPAGVPAQEQKNYLKAAQDTLAELNRVKSPDLKYLGKLSGYYGGGMPAPVQQEAQGPSGQYAPEDLKRLTLANQENNPILEKFGGNKSRADKAYQELNAGVSTPDSAALAFYIKETGANPENNGVRGLKPTPTPPAQPTTGNSALAELNKLRYKKYAASLYGGVKTTPGDIEAAANLLQEKGVPLPAQFNQ